MYIVCAVPMQVSVAPAVALREPLLLNYALCMIKLKSYTDAIEHASIVISNNSVRAALRMWWSVPALIPPPCVALQCWKKRSKRSQPYTPAYG